MRHYVKIMHILPICNRKWHCNRGWRDTISFIGHPANYSFLRESHLISLRQFGDRILVKYTYLHFTLRLIWYETTCLLVSMRAFWSYSGDVAFKSAICAQPQTGLLMRQLSHISFRPIRETNSSNRRFYNCFCSLYIVAHLRRNAAYMDSNVAIRGACAVPYVGLTQWNIVKMSLCCTNHEYIERGQS